MKSKYPKKSVIALVIVFILILVFYLYGTLTTETVEPAQEKYVVEEIVEPADIIPDETEEIPLIEETKEPVEVLNEVTIEIYNGKYYPDKITISPGTVVTWINKDPLPHKLVAYDRIFYSPRMQPGDKYSFTFTKVGSHRYFDAVFPKAGKGKIIVKEEPMPITGRVIGIDLDKQEADGKFAALILLFVIMTLGLSHGIYTHHRI